VPDGTKEVWRQRRSGFAEEVIPLGSLYEEGMRSVLVAVNSPGHITWNGFRGAAWRSRRQSPSLRLRQNRGQSRTSRSSMMPVGLTWHHRRSGGKGG
jgi:hypothetical protein